MLFRQHRLEHMRDWLLIAVWLVPLTYWISSFGAASPHLAKIAVFIQLVHVAAFSAAAYLMTYQRGAELLRASIWLSGYVVVWYGFACLFGNTYYHDAVMVEAYGLRLTSVFQYANTYSAYLIALLLIALALVVQGRRKWSIAIHAFMILPILVSFWATLSRGGLVVLPVIVLLVLPFLKMVRQLAFITYLGIGAVASLLLQGPITNQAAEMQTKIRQSLSPEMEPGFLYSLTDPLSASKWGWLLVGSLIVGALIFAIQVWAVPALERKWSSWGEKRWSRFALPVVSVAAGTLLIVLLFGSSTVRSILPDTLERRIENINFQQHSVLERSTFYSDSLKLFKDYPLLGKGGGAWAAMYEQYQNNPYTSRQAHSFYLQYLNETGLVGALVFVALLAVIAVLFIRYYSRADEEQRTNVLPFYLVTVALLVHSAIDFNISYVYISLLLFLSLGAMASTGAAVPVEWFKQAREHAAVRFVFPSLVAVFAVFMFVNSLIFTVASSKFETALAHAREQKPLDQVMQPLDTAIKRQPGHPEYSNQKLQFMLQLYEQTQDEKYLAEAENLLDHLKKKEPYMRQLVLEEYQINKYRGQTADNLALMQETVKEKFPWDIQFYELLAASAADLMDQANNAGDQAAFEVNAKIITDTIALVEAKEKKLKEELPPEQMQGRPFKVTSPLTVSLSRIYYAKGQYDQMAAAIKPFVNPELPTAQDVIAARLYVVAMSKLGTPDEKLYNAIIQKDEKEKDYIAAMLAAAK
ncbi:O-antigen ligase family protein [Paenibacillus thermoaerophilus]|uniref:O-antigen ligase family protein n=1 Tax=Paenibacillus thermoaerophilus TaxID=1215385 RepID=A0ABW2V2X6_9BACL|nr:O-antigen ligase family protein [Paenibacillus thermoaerophilus]